MLNVLDLFSGIGGLSLGLERTGGFKTMAFCEIDPFCQKVLKKHWPDVPIYDDIKTLTYDKLKTDGYEAIDVITGGFPCQDLSTAGKKVGISGELSGLWSEYKRLISEIRPRYAVVENVPGLLSGERGAWFGRLLGDLAEIGYNAEWHCIPAYYVGAPHIRDRVWIIAYSDKTMLHGCETIQDYINVQRADNSYIYDKTYSLLRHKRDELRTNRISLRDDDGFSDGVDRLGACGNSVIPQIVELIGNAILNIEKQNAK